MNQQTKVIAAFLALYTIWGSTYLAIRIVIESLPPFFMAGTRFITAGAILYFLTSLNHPSRPTKKQWKNAFIVGGLMLLGGNGAVVWAEQTIPSGLTSLLVATVPLWIALLDWAWNRTRPTMTVVGGLALGFVGVALLVGGVQNLGASSVNLVVAVVLVFGAFLWANGSLYSRRTERSDSQFQATAQQMLAGGTLLLVASISTGEWARIQLDHVTTASFLSWIYLIIFGSLVGFTSYIWLLKVSQPSRVSTYAYVNPVVAMLLGWIIANEPLTARNIVAATLILVAVVVITTFQPKREKTRQEQAS